MNENEQNSAELEASQSTESPSSESSELFDSTQPQPESEGSKETPSGNEKSQKKESEVQKEKQIQAWKTAVKSGEKSLDDAPAWVRDEIESSVKPDSYYRELARKEIEATKAQKRYEALKAELQDLNLDKAQQEELSDEFKALKEAFPEDIALKKAMKIVGVQTLKERRSKYDGVLFPDAGGAPSKDSRLEDMSDSDIVNSTPGYTGRA